MNNEIITIKTTFENLKKVKRGGDPCWVTTAYACNFSQPGLHQEDVAKKQRRGGREYKRMNEWRIDLGSGNCNFLCKKRGWSPRWHLELPESSVLWAALMWCELSQRGCEDTVLPRPPEGPGELPQADDLPRDSVWGAAQRWGMWAAAAHSSPANKRLPRDSQSRETRAGRKG